MDGGMDYYPKRLLHRYLQDLRRGWPCYRLHHSTRFGLQDETRVLNQARGQNE